MKRSSKAKLVLGMLAIGAVVVITVKAQAEVRRRREIADTAMTNIQSELDNLDPVSRAAVVAKLGADEVRRPGGAG